MNTQELDKEYVAGTYARVPVTIVSGKGSLCYDENGKEYIDMGTGIGVNSFGIADEVWQKAIIDQIGQVQHMSNLYYTKPCAELASLICQKTGMKKVFFGNSGAEANECVIKVARKWAAENKGKDCYNIITMWNSFHGRTLTTLAATGQDHYHELFQPLTPGFKHVHINDMEELKATADPATTAAIMMEMVQGEGGVQPLDADYIKAVAAYCKENNILLIVDEVQTGNGRSGKLYSYMCFDIQPDIVSTAKGIAGGLPMGAALLSEKVQYVLGPGDHGSTYGGNPVAAAAGCSIMKRLDDKFLAEVAEKGAFLKAELEGAEGIELVTGLGLMVGVKPSKKSAAEVIALCREKGVLCLTAKDRIRLLPALNIPKELLKKAADVIKECCK